MKAPKLLLGALILLSTQGFSQTDTTKTPKDTTKKKDFSFVSVLDTVPGKKDDPKKDTSKWLTYVALDTVPKKDTTDKKKDLSFNDVAKGPFAVEDAYIVLDTVPNDTTKKPSGWGSLAPIPQAQPLTEFKSSAPAPNAGKYYVAVLGTYQPENTNTTATTTEAQANTTTTTAGSNVTITVDEQNPGKIWISGLGDDKFYAYLKTNADIYKIPTQKVSDKKSISEGIVSYNEASKEVHIRIGSGFNDADPNASLNATQAVTAATESTEKTAEKPVKKGKNSHAVAKAPVKKVISFDGIKTDAGTASL
jgi:hypothetical protein